MKKILVLPCIFVVVGLFLWWINGGAKQEITPPASLDANTTAEKQTTPNVRDIKFSQAVSPKSGLLLYDPVVVTPCNLVPLQEQNISSQVDGIIEDVLVDLGQQVEQGQLLAKLDDHQVRAQADLLRIRAMSESAQRIAQSQHDEADSKVTYATKANENGLIAVPELEFKTYILQRERYAQEVKKAREEQEIARKELEKTNVIVDLHQLKSGINGEVVKVFKRPGEAVRQAEPLFRVANCERIRIEGLCKVQQADLLRVGMTALVEPELRGEQLTEMTGHTAPITSLAISGDGQLLASASEDRTVILWGWPQGNRLCLLPHPGEVNAVAFAPARNQSGDVLLMTGSGDGQARLWHIAAGGAVKAPIVFAQGHENAIRAVAFSRDGQWCATGGEDKRIGIWEVATGKHLYWVTTEEGASSVHKGAVTSLSFTPDGHLVSAGRDNCLRVWQINATSANFIDQISGRTGEVSQFSVSPDGNQLLFDHGEELRLLDRRTWDSLGSFRSQRQGRFAGMAHFSPTGKLVLTTANNGRVQLWKVPAFAAATQRLLNLNSYEVRYFSPPNALPITCGAFAPDEKVIFTGGVDKVIRVWPVPPEADWYHPLEATITYIGTQVERGTDTLRLRAEMDNPLEPGRRLRPGTFATLKIYPPVEKGDRSSE
jgi:WD40 repeat protein/biotin carboxyl carrier protein